MSIWVRNLGLPYQDYTSWSPKMCGFFMRELFLVGNWTENSNDGDADWTSANNVVATVAAGASGLEVEAANPRQIYSPTGIFTQQMVDDQCVLSLLATNDQNRSAWRMVNFIDVNNVEIDASGFTPLGWTDETQMAARITKYDDRHSSGAWVLMDAPSGNMQARINLTSDSNIHHFVRPRGGDGESAEAPTTNTIVMGNSSEKSVRMNAYFNGTTAIFYQFADQNGTIDFVMWGELIDTVTGDDDPGFVFGRGDIQTRSFYELYLYMIDHSGSPASIAAYINWLSEYQAQSAADSLRNKLERRQVNGGLTGLESPYVQMDDVSSVGGYRRGRLPAIRTSYTDFEICRPIGAVDYLHLVGGLVVPRNGSSDQIPITS